MEMQERFPAHVEDSAGLLDHLGPGANLGEEVGQIVEQLGWATRQGPVVRSSRPVEHVAGIEADAVVGEVTLAELGIDEPPAARRCVPHSRIS